MAELSVGAEQLQIAIVDAGIVMHKDAQTHGDAQVIRSSYIRGERFILQGSMSTQVYPNMLYICTCATHPYRP